MELISVHSNPFAICVHGTQEAKAVGTILWYNYFGSVHETSQASLGAITKLLNDYLVNSTSLDEKLNPLNEYQLYHIKIKIGFRSRLQLRMSPGQYIKSSTKLTSFQSEQMMVDFNDSTLVSWVSFNRLQALNELFYAIVYCGVPIWDL